MKKTKSIYFMAVFLLLCFIGFMAYSYFSKPHVLRLGAYDPEDVLVDENSITIQEVFFEWNTDIKNIQDSVKKIENLNRTPFITLEPWQSKSSLKDTNLLSDVYNGTYDKTILNICSTLSTFQGEVLVRWGHEMELTNSRYPWSGKKPSDYIKAYQHFVDVCRTVDTNIKFVWSPSGEENLKDYWPGDDYVDFIGISAYSFDQWDEKNVGHQRTFLEIFSQKYNRIKKFKKPIIITETGVTGSLEYRMTWFKNAISSSEKISRLYAIIFFNGNDTPGAWGKDYSTPDWRFSLNFFEEVKTGL